METSIKEAVKAYFDENGFTYVDSHLDRVADLVYRVREKYPTMSVRAILSRLVTQNSEDKPADPLIAMALGIK